MVGLAGLEPPTSPLSGRRPSQICLSPESKPSVDRRCFAYLRMVGLSETSQTKEPRADFSLANLYNGLKTSVVITTSVQPLPPWVQGLETTQFWPKSRRYVRYGRLSRCPRLRVKNTKIYGNRGTWNGQISFVAKSELKFMQTCNAKLGGAEFVRQGPCQFSSGT